MKDPVKRAEKFVRGLDAHIQKLLIGTPPTTHEAALTAAHGWELITEEERAAQARARRAPAAHQHLPAPPAPIAPVRMAAALRTLQTTAFKPTFGASSSTLTGANRIPLVCTFCDNPGHSKETCKKYNKLCLRCGKPDHMIRDCPHPDARLAVVGARAPQQQQIITHAHQVHPIGQRGGQAFALTTEQAEAAAPVITGMTWFIFSISCYFAFFICSCIS